MKKNYVTLEEVCVKGSSNIAQKDLEKNEGKYPIYGASGFIKNVDFYAQDKPYIAVVKDGAGIGRTMMLPAHSSVIGTMQYLLPKDNIDISYLYYAVTAMNLAKYYTGATIPHIYFKDYRKEKLPVVDKIEQKKIVEVLSKIDALVIYHKRQLDDFEVLLKSRFIEMFGDKDYPHKKLAEVACICSSKRIYANEYVSEGVPFYRSKEIRELGDGKRPSVELFISSEKYNFLKARFGVPQKGDILIAAIGATIGYMWVINTDNPFYYKDGNLILISDFRELNSMYLEFVLKKLISKFKEQGAAGSAQLALTIEKVEKMEVAVPPIELQNQFADFVEQVNKSKLEVQKSLEELETLKKSLMQQYFG